MNYSAVRNDGIQVDGTGTVLAPYERANFSITVSEIALTSAKAKEAMRETTDAVMAYVSERIKDGTFRNRVSSLSVAPHHAYEGNVHKFVGYKVSLKITFETQHVDRVSEFQDQLTEFPKSEVAAVTYGFIDVEPLREKALERAWEQVSARWANQSRILRAASSAFEVSTWEVDYEETKPLSKLSNAADEMDQPGLAAVRVSLSVLFKQIPGTVQ